MNDTNNNGHLHLIRVGKDQGIRGTMPSGIQAEEISVAVESADGPICRKVPARVKEVERLREDIVVNESSVSGKGAHEKDDITATSGMSIGTRITKSKPRATHKKNIVLI